MEVTSSICKARRGNETAMWPYTVHMFVLAMSKPRLFLDRRPSSFAFVPKKDKPSFFFHDFFAQITMESVRFFFDPENFGLTMFFFL